MTSCLEFSNSSWILLLSQVLPHLRCYLIPNLPKILLWLCQLQAQESMLVLYCLLDLNPLKYHSKLLNNWLHLTYPIFSLLNTNFIVSLVHCVCPIVCLSSPIQKFYKERDLTCFVHLMYPKHLRKSLA